MLTKTCAEFYVGHSQGLHHALVKSQDRVRELERTVQDLRAQLARREPPHDIRP